MLLVGWCIQTFFLQKYLCLHHALHAYSGWVLFFGLQCMLKCTKNSVEASNNNYIIHLKPKKGRFDWNFGTMLIIQCNFKKIKILRKIEDIYVFCKIRRNFFRSLITFDIIHDVSKHKFPGKLTQHISALDNHSS